MGFERHASHYFQPYRKRRPYILCFKVAFRRKCLIGRHIEPKVPECRLCILTLSLRSVTRTLRPHCRHRGFARVTTVERGGAPVLQTIFFNGCRSPRSIKNFSLA